MSSIPDLFSSQIAIYSTFFKLKVSATKPKDIMDIYVIPDTQVKPGIDYSYFKNLAKHISEEKPDYIIHGGDHWDMPSLSSYDKGKKSKEEENYQDDVRSGNDAFDFFFYWLDKYWKSHKTKCKKIILRGNHEERIKRAWEYGDATLRKLMFELKPDYSRWDRVIPFLKPLKVNDVLFSHYFPNDNSGKPITRAHLILQKRHKSCVAFHQQGFDYHEQLTGDGKIIHGIIAGSCYLHDEAYKGPNNHHFRGTLILRNVKDGMFDVNKYSLKYIMEKYK